MDKLLIPWSSGLDSTMLLVRALERTKLEVHTNYVRLDNNDIKRGCEERAIQVLQYELGQTYREFTHHEGTRYDLPEFEQNGPSIQPMLWLLSMIPLASQLVSDLDYDDDFRVQIGYVKGDPILAEMDRIDVVWKTLWDSFIVEHPAPILETPLRHMEKTDILRALKRYEEHKDISLVDLIWTCESPLISATGEVNGYARCESCDPCLRDPRFSVLDESN